MQVRVGVQVSVCFGFEFGLGLGLGFGFVFGSGFVIIYQQCIAAPACKASTLPVLKGNFAASQRTNSGSGIIFSRTHLRERRGERGIC